MSIPSCFSMPSKQLSRYLSAELLLHHECSSLLLGHQSIVILVTFEDRFRFKFLFNATHKVSSRNKQVSMGYIFITEYPHLAALETFVHVLQGVLSLIAAAPLSGRTSCRSWSASSRCKMTETWTRRPHLWSSLPPTSLRWALCFAEARLWGWQGQKLTTCQAFWLLVGFSFLPARHRTAAQLGVRTGS